MTMSKTPTRWKVKSRDEMTSPVEVVFVSDSLIEQIIPNRKGYEKLLLKRVKDRQPELQDSLTESPNRKRKLADNKVEDRVVLVKKVKRDEDVESALAALENDKNKEIKHSELKTPKVYNNNKQVNGETKSPVNSEEQKCTPYSLRRRTIKDIEKIQHILENSDEDAEDFTASESEYSSQSSSASSDDESEEESPTKLKGAQAFFVAKKISKKLGKVQSHCTFNLTHQETEDILKNMVSNAAHRSHIKQLLKSYTTLFNKWDTLLRHNYSILLHGVGSKKSILERYIHRHGDACPVITVNGYFPSVTAKDVLERLCEPLRVDSSSSDALETVESLLNESEVIFYLGINNIDGVMLRNKKCQALLSRLARNRYIRLVASVDHINSPLMWDHCMQTDFNWASFDITTFIPYNDETKYEGDLLAHVQSGGRVTLSSLRSVYQSLPHNAKGVFLKLVRTQLSNVTSSFSGMSFRELYHACKSKMLVQSDAALRACLKEFIDHTVIKPKKSSDGDEIYYVNVDNAILTKFADEHCDEFC